MFQVYVNEKECKCPSSLKEADCECFTITNKRVPLRLSPAQKIFSRLWFMNNNAQSKNLDTNMRLREARLYLKQSTDIVVLRYANLWFKKSLNFAKEADAEIIKLANLLKLDVVLPSTTLTQEANRLMIDDDDEAVEGPAFNFSSPQTRNEPYSADQNSAQKQLLNYNSQSDADFQDRFLYNNIQSRIESEKNNINTCSKGFCKRTKCHHYSLWKCRRNDEITISTTWSTYSFILGSFQIKLPKITYDISIYFQNAS